MLASGSTTLAAAQEESPVPSVVPKDPYLITAHGAPIFRPRSNYGWERQSTENRIRIIRGLHSDFADFRRLIWISGENDGLPPGAAQQAEFSLRENLPGTSGQTIYLNRDQDKVKDNRGDILERQEWKYPDGSAVEEYSGLFAEGFEGDVQGYGVQNDGIAIPSIFAPGTLDILLTDTRKAFNVGFSGMFLDSTTTPRLLGLDFSVWAQAGFQNHLSELSAEELSELGISNPAEFDIRQYIRDAGIGPKSDENPVTDPVFREYLLFNHRGLKAFLSAYKSRLREAFPNRSDDQLVLYGNQYMGGDLANTPAASIYISEEVDFVNIEDNRTKPPEIVRDFLYKLMWAAGKAKKPVLFEGQIHDQPGQADSLQGLDLNREYRTLRRLQFAEAYANGVPRKIPLTSWGNIHIDKTISHWVQSDGSIPDTLQAFADFLWVNERHLRGVVPANQVAVVYSIPTQVFERIPQWGRETDQHTDAFRGVVKLLRESQIPYDIRIFGHDELYDDSVHLDALSDYNAVVLPGISSIADRQVRALEAVTENGGKIITTSSIPDRDESYESRDWEFFTTDAVTNLDNPGIERIQNGEGTGELVDAVATQTRISAQPSDALGINLLTQSDPKSLQVHLLNYDYEVESDEIRTKTEIEIELSNPDFSIEAAEFVSPQTTERLDVKRNEASVTVTVPELHEWGFILFVPNESSLSAPGSQDEASERMESVSEQLDDVSDSFRTANPEVMARVETIQREAAIAFDAEVYDKAVERAAVALDILSETQAESKDPQEEPTEDPVTSNSTDVTTNSENSTANTNSTTPGFGLLTTAGAGIGGLYLAKLFGEDSE